jgi:hypothetical protein
VPTSSWMSAIMTRSSCSKNSHAMCYLERMSFDGSGRSIWPSPHHWRGPYRLIVNRLGHRSALPHRRCFVAALLIINLFCATLLDIDPGVGAADDKEGVAKCAGRRAGSATTQPSWRGLEAALFTESTGMGMPRRLV